MKSFEGDVNGVQKTLTNEDTNLSQSIKKTDHIKIINIKEDNAIDLKERYLYNFSKKNKENKLRNIKVYNVEYDVKYKEGANTSEKNGKNQCWFWVVRKDFNSPWLINGMGQP